MNETPTVTLADLKAGDVAYVEGSGYARFEKVTIAKITATQIVCDNGDRYHREDGSEIGRKARWSFYTLQPATPRMVAKYQRQENLSVVKGMQWETLDDATLAAVVALLPKKGA